MARNRRREARIASAAQIGPANTDLLREAIQREQAKAYASLGLGETIHLHEPAEAFFSQNPQLIEAILNRHYFDQTDKIKDFVRQKLADTLINDKAASPLSLQDQRYYRHILHYWKLIQQHMPEFGLSEKSIPLVATMPIPELNAQTWKFAQQEGHAVVFNEAMLTFLFLLSKVVARYFPGDITTDRLRPERGTLSVLFDRRHVNEVLTTDHSGLQDLVNLLTGHIYKGNPLADTKPFLLERQPNTVAGLLIAFSELFVFAHELAHIVHGDLVGANTEKIPGVGDEFDVLSLEQQQELNADAKALICLINVSDRLLGPNYLSLVYWAAELFLCAVELSERSVTFVKFGHEAVSQADTHPPVPVRRSSLRQVLRRHVTRECALLPPYSEWEVAISHADILVDLIDALWRDARRALAVARATGHPISPRWDSV